MSTTATLMATVGIISTNTTTTRTAFVAIENSSITIN
jgi:hypothetical protein